MAPPLHDWETFLVIVGSSAAALTGLQFVVIALISEASGGGEREIQAFGTPTVVHFCAVLLITALAAVPGQTASSFSICMLVTAIANLCYLTWVTRQATRTSYQPVFEDWLFHTILPFLAYGALAVAGVTVRQHPAGALYVVGGVVLLLLFVGIHNAWDTAMFIATRELNAQQNGEGKSSSQVDRSAHPAEDQPPKARSRPPR